MHKLRRDRSGPRFTRQCFLRVLYRTQRVADFFKRKTLIEVGQAIVKLVVFCPVVRITHVSVPATFERLMCAAPRVVIALQGIVYPFDGIRVSSRHEVGEGDVDLYFESESIDGILETVGFKWPRIHHPIVISTQLLTQLLNPGQSFLKNRGGQIISLSPEKSVTLAFPVAHYQEPLCE